MRIVCISDTHTHHRSLYIPDGDLLVHAGDFTNVGDLKDVYSFAAWLRDLPHANKVVIAGNHDFCFENDNFYSARAAIIDSGAIYLQDEGCQILSPDEDFSVNVYGTPWQPWFHDWAFNLRTEEEMQEKWEMIWPNTDILLVHGPPAKLHDKTEEGVRTGSSTLGQRIQQIKPGLVVCGHIHEDRGVTEIDNEGHHRNTWVANASCLTRKYKIQPGPQFVFETDDGKHFDVVEH
jgi:predicted phosphodiesterase